MKQAKSKKDAKKSEEPPAEVSDPLSGSTDPLSLPPANDPLSAALLDPLSQAAAEAGARSFGAKPEKVREEWEGVRLREEWERGREGGKWRK